MERVSSGCSRYVGVWRNEEVEGHKVLAGFGRDKSRDRHRARKTHRPLSGLCFAEGNLWRAV